MQRLYIGIYGVCNSGKSTLFNMLADSPLAIVSPQAGTTTDIVRKAVEIPGLGPVVLLDTAGVDDTSELGRERVARTLASIPEVDMAFIVFEKWGEEEGKLAARFEELGTPCIKIDRQFFFDRDILLRGIASKLSRDAFRTPGMFQGLVEKGDRVVLVCPIDSGAPAGRLILPQVQALRELLDLGAVAVVVQPQELDRALVPAPRLVVVDSQVLREVRQQTPPHIEVTSFSILLAAAKGDRAEYERGLEAVDRLKDGDRILIAENCAHRASCEDIGRVKIPAWIEEYTNHHLQFDFCSGNSPLPEELSAYALIVQCGGCMVNRKTILARIAAARRAGVPVTNYGMLINKVR